MNAAFFFSITGGLLAGALHLTAQDRLIVPDGSAPAGDSLLLPVSLAGPSPVVAMQFDIRVVTSVVEVLAPLPAGESNHRAMSRELEDGWRRVVVFSRSNALLPKEVVIDLPMVMSATTAGQPAPMIRIEGLFFALADGTKIIPSIQRGPLDTWFRANFSEAELEVPSIYGDSSDPDGDGLPNLVEYGLGGSPLLDDATLLPVVNAETGPAGEDLWRLTFWKARNTPGVVVEPQLSPNLVDWTTLPATPTGEEDATGIEFSTTVDRTGSSRQFIRVNVRRSE